MSKNIGFGNQVIKGSFWIVALEVSNQVLQFVKTFYAATILTPVDFGVVGFAFLVISLIDVLSTTGLKEAIIQRKDDLQSYISTVWLVEVTKGTFILLLALLLAFPIASMAGAANPTLTANVVKLIAVIYFLQCLTNTGVVYFEKNIQFHKFFLYQFSGTLADVVVSLVLVYTMQNVWALFYGILAGAFTRVVLSFILTDQRPSLHFSYSKFRELLAYGKWIFRGRIFTFLGLQLDSIIVSTFLGLYALGIYQMAFRIGSLPINQVTNVMGRIVFPAFSQAQDDHGKVKEYFLTINNVLLVGIAPLVIMIFCLIPEFTAVFLGEKWLGIVPIVRILILSGYARIFVSILDYLFCAIGEPKLAAKMQFNRFVAFGVAIAPLAYFWNITGVALSGLLALLVVWVIYLRKACLMLDIRSSDLRSVYYYPLLFNFIMAVVLYFLKTVIPADDFLRFCMQSSLLCIVYAGVVFLLGRYTSLNFFGRAISIVKSYKLRT